MYKRIGTTPCLRVCPACLSGSVGADGRIAHSTYNRERCHTRAQTYGIGSFQKSLLAIIDEDDADRRHAMIHGDFFTKSLWPSASTEIPSPSASSACGCVLSAGSTGSWSDRARAWGRRLRIGPGQK
jgi:hypothetical protein